MGMYDVIADELFCPFCGKKQEANAFQSKDMSCMLDTWTIDDIIKFQDKETKINIYHTCNNCNKWISINLEMWFLKNDKSN